MFSTEKFCNFRGTFQYHNLTAYARYRLHRNPYSKDDNGDDDDDNNDDDRIISLTNVLNKQGAGC